MELGVSSQLFEKYPNTNFIKIRPVAAELFQADRERRTDRHDEGNKRLS